jgi:acyl carrier protein
MTDTFSQTQDIFRQVFKSDALEIQETTTASDISAWDSLNHIRLVSALEAHFGIKFALGELQKLKNVGMMVDLIEKKLAG